MCRDVRAWSRRHRDRGALEACANVRRERGPPPKALVVSVGCGGPSFRHEGCKTGKHEPSPRQARRRVRALVAARGLRRSRRAVPRGCVRPEPVSDGHPDLDAHPRHAYRLARSHAAPGAVGVERSRCRPRLPRALHGPRPRRAVCVVVQRRHPARRRREPRVRVSAGLARGRSRRLRSPHLPLNRSRPTCVNVSWRRPRRSRS